MLAYDAVYKSTLQCFVDNASFYYGVLLCYSLVKYITENLKHEHHILMCTNIYKFCKIWSPWKTVIRQSRELLVSRIIPFPFCEIKWLRNW